MSLASFFAQLLNGLAGASALFLVAAGLTLIFGVTRVVNFAHGSLYMLGAYIAYSLASTFGRGPLGFWGAVVLAALAVALIGVLIETLLLKRIYAAPELLQLAATFGVVLIVRDAALLVWGAEDLLGPRAPGLSGAMGIFGQLIPTYDLFLLAVGPLVLLALWALLERTRFGMLTRAATENRTLASALGINERTLFTTVFALGAFLAGLAGALQLPREPANLGMDLAIIAEAFVVTVVGGLGSIPGAFVAALLIGLTKALCIALGTVEVGGLAIAFPKLTLVAEFVVMAIVLIAKPYGLMGAVPSAPPTTPLAEFRALVVPPGRRAALGALAALALAAALPWTGDEYRLILATDILVFTLFAASLQLVMGPGGMASFGHAAYFGLGAYAAALAAKHGMPMEAALLVAPLAAAAGALAIGWFCVRLSGVYMAMLTLAFAQIVWSIAYQWDAVTGGSNGIVGVWPSAWLPGKQAYYGFALALTAAALAALAWIAHAPLGYSLRACRDSPLRAAAIGIDVRRTQWTAFALAGGFAGLAGGIYAFSKGSISPETLAIPRSVDALVMVLLGGLNALAGPLIGAAAFTWLSDTLARATEYWRAVLGATILLIVIAFPMGIGGTISHWLRRRASAAGPPQGANSSPSGGSAAAALANEAASVGAVQSSAAGPPQGANSSPSGGSAAAALANEAASVGAVQCAAVLRVDGLTKSFGGDDVVHDVSFTVAAGELVALIGPNGAGKTTCFNLVNGQLAPDAGTVTLAGTRIDGLPPRTIARMGVGRTFQVAAAFASMTVRENVQLALLAHAGAHRGIAARATDRMRPEADALLERVRMSKFAGQGCATLAYGDAKRVELALALACAPRLLLMDEPTAGMSPRSRERLMQLAADLAREKRIAVLFTEHDMDVVFGHANRIIVLDRGRVIADGTPDAIRADARVQAVYLGEET